MPPKRSRRPVLSTTSPPPEIDPPSKRQKKGSQSQSLTIDYDLLADAILKKQNQFNPNPSTIVHHNVPPPVTEQISTSSVVPSGNACEQNHRSAVLSQNDTIPASQTVSLQVSSEPNQQPCPQPSVEPDTLSVPAVLNTLFGGESATNHDPQPLNFSNNIPLGATVSAKLKQKIWDNSYFDIRLLLPNQQDDNCSVSVERGAINFQQGKFQKFPISINQWTSAFLIYASIFIQKTPSDAAHLFKYIYMIRDMSFTTKTDSWRYYDEEFRKLRQSAPLPWQEPLQELVMRANLQPFKFRPSNQSFLAKSKSNNFQTSEAKFCYSLNQGQACRSDPCTYKHACQYCKEQHLRFKCPKLPSNEERLPSKNAHSSKARNS